MHTTFGFTGQREDTQAPGSSGLYYFNARYYDPVVGRFTSADPTQPDLGSPWGTDAYGYVGGMVEQATDPSGLMECSTNCESGGGPSNWGPLYMAASALHGFGADDGNNMGGDLVREAGGGYGGGLGYGPAVDDVSSDMQVTRNPDGSLTFKEGTPSSLDVEARNGDSELDSELQAGMDAERTSEETSPETGGGTAGGGSGNGGHPQTTPSSTDQTPPGTAETTTSPGTETGPGRGEPPQGDNIVYRGLAKGENPAQGITARAPDAVNVSPVSHVAGKRESPWISATKDLTVATEKYGTNGVVAIDLSRIPTQVVDFSNGIPGREGQMISYWAAKDKEVLIFQFIPPGAILWP